MNHKIQNPDRFLRVSSCGGAGLEAEAVVSSLQNVAAMGEAIEERGGHLGIAEEAGSFAEAEVGGYVDAGALVEFAQQVEEQRPA